MEFVIVLFPGVSSSLVCKLLWSPLPVLLGDPTGTLETRP